MLSQKMKEREGPITVSFDSPYSLVFSDLLVLIAPLLHLGYDYKSHADEFIALCHIPCRTRCFLLDDRNEILPFPLE